MLIRKVFESFSFAILSNTFRERTKQDWDKKYLLSFGLVTKEEYLTNAGMLFADDCNLSQSRLCCTRWNGLEKNDALNDSEFKGNILLLLREAMNFVKSNTRKGWEKLPNGRKNKPEYAERAVLEALVNHFIHRDYTMMGGEVHLDIYDDRIALTSSGGMYNGQKVQDIPIEEISSDRRNPVLADVMAQLDLMEKRGSGLKRICNETKMLESYKEERKPVFKSTPCQFMTVIYSLEYDGGVNGPVSGLVNGPVNGPVNSLKGVLREVFLIVKNNPGIKIKQVAEARGKSESTVKKQLATLKKMDLIEYRDSDKTGGYYVK